MPSRCRRRWLVIAVLLVGTGVLARALLPIVLARELNRRLDTMGQYHGQIESVDLQVWRGAYAINHLRIVKRSGAVPVPLIDAPRIDLAVRWRELLHGAVVAEVDFRQAEINLVDGKGEADTQSGRGVDWRQQLETLAPVRLDAIRFHDSVVHFRNYQSRPRVDLTAAGVNAAIANLTNVRDADGERVATLDATASVLGDAPVEAHARFDPFGSLEEFSFELRVLGVRLERANDFLQAYARIDAASGQGDFVMELQASDGRLTGYAKPLLRDVKIFSWKQDVEAQKDHPLRVVWEALAGAAETLLKNQKRDQLATRVPISGRIDDPHVGTWDALLAVLRNAFVEALKPQFEHLPERDD